MRINELAGTARPRDLWGVVVVAIVLIATLTNLNGSPEVPRLDGELYARYALGLTEFGTFGPFESANQKPLATQVVTPLYPGFLAILIEVDSELRASLRCALESSVAPATPCPKRFWTVAIVQGAFTVVFLITVWLSGLIFTSSRLGAWIAMAFAVPWRPDIFYSRLYLTEALTLPLLGLMTLFLLLAYRQQDRWLWPLLCGICTGLLTLTKPTFAYLFWFLLACGAVVFVVSRAKRSTWTALLLFAFAHSLLVGSWMVRNWIQLDSNSLTTGYGANTLSHRVAYNRMSASEWGAAFVYWLPDFGDDMAKWLLPAPTYEKLGWGPESYYIFGAKALFNSTRQRAGGPENHLDFLLKTEVAGNFIKHTLVSIPLAWRGMFVKSYGGFLGWICCVWLLFWTAKHRRWAFWVLCLPAFFLVAFHAGVSVSIPRYNIALIPVMSLAIATAVVRIAGLVVAQIKA